MVSLLNIQKGLPGRYQKCVNIAHLTLSGKKWSRTYYFTALVGQMQPSMRQKIDL